ncbi:hypothetical protein AYJ66_07260 [Dietzia cinnamea]|nr:hypothetical protein AYJ66_07260 [Dietzia cinnamea]
MSNHVTMIEKAFNAANTALGIEPNYPKPLTDALKRRDAAAELVDYRPMNVAQELAASNNPRQWPSILDRCAAHNARAEQAQAAIRGGLLSGATAQLDHQFKAYVPEYTTSVYKTVEAHLNALTEAAQACPTLNADSAVKGGYGDAMTRFYQHAQIIVTYTGVGTITAPANRPAQAARALALVTDPGTVNVVKRTPASRWNEGGELRSPEADIRRRDITRGLLTDWIKNPTETLRRLGRDEYQGFTLSPATADTYADRVEQFANAERIERVTD